MMITYYTRCMGHCTFKYGMVSIEQVHEKSKYRDTNWVQLQGSGVI